MNRYSSVEYFWSSIFLLKESWVYVCCHLADLDSAAHTTLALVIGLCFSTYWERCVTHLSKFGSKMQLLAKSPLVLLLMIAKVYGSDKLVNSSLIYRIKWIMAMAQWLTLLKCHCIQLNYYYQVRIMHWSQGSRQILLHSNQSERLGTMMCFTIVCRTSNIYFASCPSMLTCLSLLLEASTHFPWIQTMLSQPNLYIFTIKSSTLQF